MLILIPGLLLSTRVGIMAQIASMGQCRLYLNMTTSRITNPSRLQRQSWGLVCP